MRASIYANFGVGPPKVDTGSGCLRGWLSSGNFCLLMKRNIVKTFYLANFKIPSNTVLYFKKSQIMRK